MRVVSQEFLYYSQHRWRVELVVAMTKLCQLLLCIYIHYKSTTASTNYIKVLFWFPESISSGEFRQQMYLLLRSCFTGISQTNFISLSVLHFAKLDKIWILIINVPLE